MVQGEIEISLVGILLLHNPDEHFHEDTCRVLDFQHSDNYSGYTRRSAKTTHIPRYGLTKLVNCWGSKCSMSADLPFCVLCPAVELQGEYSRAQDYFKWSQAVRELVLDPEHPGVARVLNVRALSFIAHVRAIGISRKCRCGRL